MHKYFLLFLHLLLTFALQAQNKFQSELYLGAGGGLTYSSAVIVPSYVDIKKTMGMDGGLSLRYISENHFGIQTDLYYTQIGWEDDYGYASTESYKRLISFVELPFLMHAYTQTGSVRFFLNAGPKFSWYLSETEESNVQKPILYHGKKTETPFQWGLTGGGGFEVFLFKKHVLGIEGRYYYGLSDIFSNGVTDEFNTSHLQEVSIHLYYLFRLR